VQAGFGELRPLHFPSRPKQNLARDFVRDVAVTATPRFVVPCRFVSWPGREPPQLQRNKQGDDVNAKGRVKFYNEAKGYGFLTRDDGAGDVFLHRSAVPAGLGLLYEGRPVSFDIEMTPRGSAP
jgi:CspA family cold shock protein